MQIVTINSDGNDLRQLTFDEAGENALPTWTGDGANILSIELLDFFGQWDKTKSIIKLNWITTSELNTDYFDIERSVNGAFFESINQVKASGNSNSKKLYELIDGQILQNGLYLYRLISNDLDGKKSYSKTIGILVDSPTNFFIKLYPNPASTLVNLQLSDSSDDNLAIKIFDILGNMVFSNTGIASINKITHTAELDLSSLVNGTYFVKINMNDSVIIERLLVQK
jgi:hypothetical protein